MIPPESVVRSISFLLPVTADTGPHEGGLMPADLPAHPSLEHLKNQAKELLRAYRRGDPDALARFRAAGIPSAGAAPKLVDAQRLVARDYGFASWAKLKARVTSAAAEAEDPVALVRRAFHDDDA